MDSNKRYGRALVPALALAGAMVLPLAAGPALA